MPRALFSLLFLLLVSSAYSQRGDFVEFRGVWVATVKNIDWPASGQLEVQEQKDAYIKILDFYEELNFNAVIVQV
ncbi:MAG: family 10 glycosylhydrolase, partial [Cyclobacteriaceae bacterium]|nr:family 10 glycosylhydrolase [Cyclobacteriaceae bacterium HetDA_MAG_MS6]